ncbi:hypothetical protein [Mucilaginibacter sp. FT3.2]|uniref:hypothetical protein n=1 Tax=Mucilaginibacter sp. FT3.2 TaxID=2723090 RepID=UPI0016101118|nr:hypothetical protein [Mucilaginibacter sp. FT3.2]MBB6234274.1 hypothetical protein [Mucilaginibacter sp. FT3.2]
MKKHLLLSAFCISLSVLKAQTIYVDPVTAAAMLAHSAVINGQLNTTNDNLSAIERGQLAVTGQLVIVNNMQDKIYKGLSEVAGVMNSLSTIKDIAGIGTDIVSNVQQAVKTATSDPVLLLFAEQGARDFEDRALRLAVDVNAFVLKGGKSNLMDSGERAKLLNHIADELRILRGIAYGMQRAMYWAKMRGLWKSLNPWVEWQNMDVQIANSVLSEAKYLKK